VTRPFYEDSNDTTRIRTEICADAETGLPVLRAVQDVAPILEQNDRDRADYDAAKAARTPGGFRHIARIPMVVVRQLRDAGIIKGMTVVDEVRFFKFLSERDNRRLRCDNGKRLA
jgi:hypothetical protein